MINWNRIGDDLVNDKVYPEVEKMVMGKFRDGSMCTVIYEDGWTEVQDSKWNCWDELDYEEDDCIVEGFYLINPSQDHPIPFYDSLDMMAWAPLEEFL